AARSHPGVSPWFRGVRHFLSAACFFFPEKRPPWSRSILRGQGRRPPTPGGPSGSGRWTHGAHGALRRSRSPEVLPQSKGKGHTTQNGYQEQQHHHRRQVHTTRGGRTAVRPE